MTRGRKSTPRTEIVPVEIREEVVRQDIESLDQLTVLEAATADALNVGRLVGAIDAMRIQRKFCEISQIRLFQQLKESKKYKHLAIRHADGSVRPSHDFAEFCEAAFGKSYRSLAEEQQNLVALGDELYEMATRLQLRVSDFRDLRALPDDAREIVEEAGRTSTREGVIELVRTLAEKHSAAKAEVAERKKDLAAKDAVLADKIAVNTQLEQQISRMTGNPVETFNQAIHDLRERLGKNYQDFVNAVGTQEVTFETLRQQIDARPADASGSFDLDRATKDLIHQMGALIEIETSRMGQLQSLYYDHLRPYVDNDVYQMTPAPEYAVDESGQRLSDPTFDDVIGDAAHKPSVAVPVVPPKNGRTH
jgi:hypothetical protein